MLLKQLAKIVRAASRAWTARQTFRRAQRAQQTLLLMKHGRTSAASHVRPNDDGRHSTAAVPIVRALRFIEHDNQDTVLLKLAIAEQRSDVVAQPRVRLLQGAVVRIVITVWDHERYIRQIVVVQITGEVREWHQVL